jgi:hypothetical protein
MIPINETNTARNLGESFEEYKIRRAANNSKLPISYIHYSTTDMADISKIINENIKRASTGLPLIPVLRNKGITFVKEII